MSNPWFRMYSEFATDPKVQMLSEAMQRRLLMIMCMRCSNSLVTLQEQEIAFQLRITDAELEETKALFIAKKFIDKSWNLLNWEKRQFASDTSKARVAKHRLLQKEKQEPASNADVTLQKRNDNGLEQNRTDTDTDKSKEIDKSISKRPAKKCPDSFTVPEDLLNAISEECPLVDIDAQTKIFRDHTFAAAKTDWAATWRNWMRTKQERLVESASKTQGLESFKQADARLGRERWEEMTGEQHPDNAPRRTSNILDVVDITPRIGAPA